MGFVSLSNIIVRNLEGEDAPGITVEVINTNRARDY